MPTHLWTVTDKAGHTATASASYSLSTETTLEQRVSGVWVLQQVSSVTELNSLVARINDALDVPGTVGLGVRFPWDMCDITGNATTHPLLDRAKAIATAKGKELSIRFMAGEHTPTRVFDAGASWVANGNDKAPVPWSNSSGSHVVFLDAYRAYMTKLAAWCGANSVELLHCSWWALDWAELNHGIEIRGVEGYTPAKWLQGHKELVSLCAEFAGPDLAVELPLSGYGPVAADMSPALADHIISLVGANSDRFFIQANGWNETLQWGSPNATVEAQFDRIWEKSILRGVQMIQPSGYDWTKVFAQARIARANYGEVYLPSFGPVTSVITATRIAQLKTEIPAFAAWVTDNLY